MNQSFYQYGCHNIKVFIFYLLDIMTHRLESFYKFVLKRLNVKGFFVDLSLQYRRPLGLEVT